MADGCSCRALRRDTRKSFLPAQTQAPRSAAGNRGAGDGTPQQAGRYGCPHLRHDLLVRIRHRGDAYRARSRGRGGRLLVASTGDRSDPGHPHCRDVVLPRSGDGLHKSRRLLRGCEGELRYLRRPVRRGRSADRLHAHRRSPVSRRHYRPDVGHTVFGHQADRNRHIGGDSPAPPLREPAWDPRGR